MTWIYHQPTRIHFGLGCRAKIAELAGALGKRPMLVTDRALRQLDGVSALGRALGPAAKIFSEVEPNPTVAAVDALVKLIGDEQADVLVAVGGGSALDCAKAAGAIALQGGAARHYHSEGRALDARRLPLIAVPTTAGTGSEVTPIAVLDDVEKKIKAPLAHPSLFPTSAVIDPELTVSMPGHVTAATGLDALAHALEGYWSKNHQPICDLLACEAARLVFQHLPTAFNEPQNLAAREGMCRAALLGGMAFQLPKNAAVHACSFPLSSRYHLPHGAACALTLDAFIRFNAPALGERGAQLARAAGFADLGALAEAVAELKKNTGLPARLRDIGVTAADLGWLVESSFHPLMNNNPRPVSPAELRALYASIL